MNDTWHSEPHRTAWIHLTPEQLGSTATHEDCAIHAALFSEEMRKRNAEPYTGRGREDGWILTSARLRYDAREMTTEEIDAAIEEVEDADLAAYTRFCNNERAAE